MHKIFGQSRRLFENEECEYCRANRDSKEHTCIDCLEFISARTCSKNHGRCNYCSKIEVEEI
jgi:hypothetical protein